LRREERITGGLGGVGSGNCYVFAAFFFAQDAFIFTDRAFFCAEDIGLRFVAEVAGAATVAFAVLPALINAHRFFVAATMALRPATPRVRLRATGAGGGEAFAGRPRRFTGSPSASIARLSLSRSEIRRDRICSVGIYDDG
jgi:hypothetical protein